MDGATNLIVAADDRIELALAGPFGQVDAVFLQRLTIFLGPRVLHLGTAAHLLDRLFQRRALRAAGLQDAAQLAAVVAAREHEQFTGYELIAALLRQLVRDVEQLVQIVAQQDLARRPLNLRQPLQGAREFGAQLGHVGARFLQ